MAENKITTVDVYLKAGSNLEVFIERGDKRREYNTTSSMCLTKLSRVLRNLVVQNKTRVGVFFRQDTVHVVYTLRK